MNRRERDRKQAFNWLEAVWGDEGGGRGASGEVAVGAESENKTETNGRQRGLERNCLRI